MNYITTGAIAAVCSVVSGLALYAKGKQKREVTIDKQPVGVRLHDAFVTRTEFLEFKGEMKSDIREIKNLFDKAVTLIAERDERLTTKIEEVASGAYEGRRRIHETVNSQGQRLAMIESKGDISKGLATLGRAVMAATENRKQKGTADGQ